MVDAHAYYTTPGPMTDLAHHTDLLEGLTPDLPSLVKAVQNTNLHIFWAERYGYKPSEERQGAVQVRDVTTKYDLLRAMDPSPLRVERPYETRLISNCRDFTLQLVTLLRHFGVPARSRCGFATYFLPDHYEDHWVAEYWNAEQGRWVMVDGQMDAFQTEVLKLDFDPLDVPRDRFIVAGQAWQMARTGQEDPEKFGIFQWHGIWFIRGNLVRDMMALNKVEILPWDGGFGLLQQLAEGATEDDYRFDLCDRMAVLTQGGDASFAELRQVYEAEPGLHLPDGWVTPAFA